jgi:twitching motility protein PilI
MANKQALRELQSRLADRLQAARTQARGQSWLAVESGGRGFLFPLPEAGEIFSVVPVLPVPHSRPWFLGVANLRGHLHGVVELAVFLGIEPSQPGRDLARLVGLNAALDTNCVLLVDKLSGLRSDDDVTVEPADAGVPRPAFAGRLFRDAAGRSWQELSLTALAAHESFLNIVG